MFQALLILLAAATPGAGDDAKDSSQAAAENHFESVKQICEALPNVPDHTLNEVALQAASQEADKWLKKNAVGAAVQVAGRVAHLQRRDNGRKAFYYLGVQPHAGRWHDFMLHTSYEAIFAADALKSLSHVENGDRAVVKGTVVAMHVHWRKNDKAELEVTLRGCTLVNAEKPAPVEIETPIPNKATPPLTDVLKWTRANGLTFRGRLVGLNDDKAYFRSDTGKTLVAPMKAISGDDQKRIRDLVAKEMKKQKEKEAAEGQADPFTD
jgi:hypothetical protein